jgi:RimJ/RimL family protein N-acetyltransferase
MHRDRSSPSPIRIEQWGGEDLPLLERCVGDAAMMRHLGGPESPEKIAERQQRYERTGSGQFKIVDAATGTGAGWVGFWDGEWQGSEIYEIGWAVTPAFQGRGIAVSAAREALNVAGAEARHRFVHAFPALANAPSNAICRKLGFGLRGACEVEYPPGNTMRCNDWRLDLLQSALRRPGGAARR